MLAPNDITAEDRARFWSKVDQAPGQGPGGACWEWTASRYKAGYGRIRLNGIQCLTHRIAWMLASGRPVPEDAPNILHSCHNPPCCNPAHLRPGTDQDNAIDRESAGRGISGDKNWARRHPELLHRGARHWTRRHPEWLARGAANGAHTRPERRPRGESHGNALLTDAQVTEMRALWESGKYSHSAIGRLFGVSPQHARRVNLKMLRRDLASRKPPSECRKGFIEHVKPPR